MDKWEPIKYIRETIEAPGDDPWAVVKFSKFRVRDKIPKGSTLILEVPEFPYRYNKYIG